MRDFLDRFLSPPNSPALIAAGAASPRVGQEWATKSLERQSYICQTDISQLPVAEFRPGRDRASRTIPSYVTVVRTIQDINSPYHAGEGHGLPRRAPLDVSDAVRFRRNHLREVIATISENYVQAKIACLA